MVVSLHPSFGPVSGGTEITMIGSFLRRPEEQEPEMHLLVILQHNKITVHIEFLVRETWVIIFREHRSYKHQNLFYVTAPGTNILSVVFELLWSVSRVEQHAPVCHIEQCQWHYLPCVWCPERTEYHMECVTECVVIHTVPVHIQTRPYYRRHNSTL